VLSVVEIFLFLVSAVFMVLWIKASDFGYDAWAALFTILGGTGVDLLRRFIMRRNNN